MDKDTSRAWKKLIYASPNKCIHSYFCLPFSLPFPLLVSFQETGFRFRLSLFLSCSECTLWGSEWGERSTSSQIVVFPSCLLRLLEMNTEKKLLVVHLSAVESIFISTSLSKSASRERLSSSLLSSLFFWNLSSLSQPPWN